MDKKIFKVGLAPETLRQRIWELCKLVCCQSQRAMSIGGSQLGALLQGHVDGTGEIIDRWIDEILLL
jgi:riboflavin synthase alpha subunit